MKVDLTLKELRMAKGLTVESICQTLNISRHKYLGWEESPGSMPVNKAVKLAEILGADFNEIFLI